MIVVDTNIIATFLLEGEHFETAGLLMQRHPDWRVPELWKSEFRNVLNMQRRAGLQSLEQIIEIQRHAEVQLEDSASSPESTQVLLLAAESGCTPYDCEFVATAMDLGVPLVTLDKKLLRAFPEVTRSLESMVGEGSQAP